MRGRPALQSPAAPGGMLQVLARRPEGCARPLYEVTGFPQLQLLRPGCGRRRRPAATVATPAVAARCCRPLQVAVCGCGCPTTTLTRRTAMLQAPERVDAHPHVHMLPGACPQPGLACAALTGAACAACSAPGLLPVPDPCYPPSSLHHHRSSPSTTHLRMPRQCIDAPCTHQIVGSRDPAPALFVGRCPSRWAGLRAHDRKPHHRQLHSPAFHAQDAERAS